MSQLEAVKGLGQALVLNLPGLWSLLFFPAIPQSCCHLPSGDFLIKTFVLLSCGSSIFPPLWSCVSPTAGRRSGMGLPCSFCIWQHGPAPAWQTPGMEEWLLSPIASEDWGTRGISAGPLSSPKCVVALPVHCVPAGLSHTIRMGRCSWRKGMFYPFQVTHHHSVTLFLLIFSLWTKKSILLIQ